jgi:3',5'-cyclic AMP phosphodiesterase CpdA
MRRITRRAALGEALAVAGAGAVVLAGCGAAGTPAAASSGSTLQSRWGDPVGDGQLRVLPGEALVDRTDLGGRAAATSVLARLAHVTDAHVLDASSPARVTFLDRLGPPFQSTFRPQETLTAQVLAGAVNAIRAARPQLVIQGGDLIDNDQHNELERALTALGGGRVHPGSGPDGYYGVQLASNPDPFYYRPDLDAPRHPGLLRAAARPFTCRGLGAPCYPVLGDHDILVAGEIVPTPLTRSLAVGDRALWELPPGLSLPPGARAQAATSPDGPPDPGLVESFLTQALGGPTVKVPSDPARYELALPEVVAALAGGAGAAGAGAAGGGAAGGGAAGVLAAAAAERLDYTIDLGPGLRVIVLDLARRAGGSGGLVVPGQDAWLASQVAAAGERWVIVITHQPLQSSLGGADLLAVLDQSPRVIAALYGHIHRNEIIPRPTPSGGYWLIGTASLIDYPQQARSVRVASTAGGGVVIETWMLDHVLPGTLGAISRQLSFIDAQGGRPAGFAGSRLDRNVRLYRRGV